MVYGLMRGDGADRDDDEGVCGRPVTLPLPITPCRARWREYLTRYCSLLRSLEPDAVAVSWRQLIGPIPVENPVCPCSLRPGQPELVHHVTVSSKILTCEMERQQSRGMTGVTWFQYASIPHPARLVAPPPLPRPGQSWRYPGRAVSGRGNPRASSLFRLSPYPGP